MHLSRKLAIALVALAAIAFPVAALAHVDVVATSPKDGAKLDKPPRTVTVKFSEQILAGSLVVRSGGKVVSTGKGRIDRKDVRRVKTTLKAGLGKGTYVAKWIVTAPDGDKQTGTFRFTVR